jgi:hypothetical protein
VVKNRQLLVAAKRYGQVYEKKPYGKRQTREPPKNNFDSF